MGILFKYLILSISPIYIVVKSRLNQESKCLTSELRIENRIVRFVFTFFIIVKIYVILYNS